MPVPGDQGPWSCRRFETGSCKAGSWLASSRVPTTRLLSVLPDTSLGDKGVGDTQPPERFTAVAYDYTHNRALIATGPFADPDAATVQLSGLQPPVSDEEFGVFRHRCGSNSRNRPHPFMG